MAKIWYLGHSCFLFEIENKKILIDPFISGNPLAQNIDIEKITADYILLTHGHQDHVGDTISIAKRTNAELIANFEITTWAESEGIANTHPMNIGGRVKRDGISIKMVNAVHSSSFADGSYAGNPSGFLISWDKNVVYYAGDTALCSEMKWLGESENLTLAILPIGDTFTMGVEDAAIASEWLNVEKVIGMHFNTFDLIKIDEKGAMDLFNKKGKDLLLMTIESSIDL